MVVVNQISWKSQDGAGETSAKSMRGAGMEDVIFSGTTNKPEKICEVNLLEIDNKDKDGPEQYHKIR